jgi:hypothetical protein
MPLIWLIFGQILGIDSKNQEDGKRNSQILENTPFRQFALLVPSQNSVRTQNQCSKTKIRYNRGDDKTSIENGVYWVIWGELHEALCHC